MPMGLTDIALQLSWCPDPGYLLTSVPNRLSLTGIKLVWWYHPNHSDMPNIPFVGPTMYKRKNRLRGGVVKASGSRTVAAARLGLSLRNAKMESAHVIHNPLSAKNWPRAFLIPAADILYRDTILLCCLTIIQTERLICLCIYATPLVKKVSKYVCREKLGLPDCAPARSSLRSN